MTTAAEEARKLIRDLGHSHDRMAARIAALEAALTHAALTLEEWYVHDLADVLGEEAARQAAHREVAALRESDRLLKGGTDGNH